MKRLLTILALALTMQASAQITDPTYWDRKQLYANWLFDYDTVRINRLHIENQTGFDSTGNLFMYRGSTPANGELLIGTGSGFAKASLTSTGGTIDYTAGPGTLNLEAVVSGGDITGLTEDQFLFGASDGSIGQSEYVLFDDGMYAGYGAGIRIRNESSPMVLPSWAMLRLEALEGNAEIQLQAGSIAKSGIRFFNWTGNTQWYVHMDEAENFLIQNIAEDDDFRVNASTLRFTENELGEHTFFMNGGGFEIQNNDNPAVLKLDQDGTVYSIKNDGIVLEIDAPETILTGELGIGKTTSPAFDIDINENGRVEIVGTGYGSAKTIFGARYANGTFASPTAVTIGQDIGEFGFGGYKATAFTTSSAANMKATSTENWTDAATGAQLVFSVTPNTTTGSQVALTIDHDRSVMLEGKIKEYGNATPGAGSLLVGDGTDMDLFTLGSAGQVLTVNSGATAPEWATPTWSQVLGGNQDLTIPASTTTYVAFHSTSNAIEARRNEVFPVAGTIKNMYVLLSGTQNASGSIVLTMRKNGASQAVTVTIAAGSGSGVYSDTSNSFSVTAGDLVCIQVQNNATAASARIVSVVVEFEQQ